MADKLSLGPVQIFDNGVVSINDALRQVSQRFDDLKRINDPTVPFDALNLGTGNATYKGKDAGRMTYATDHWKYTDTDGTILHGAGNL